MELLRLYAVELGSMLDSLRGSIVTVDLVFLAATIAIANFLYPRIKSEIYDDDDYLKLVDRRRAFNSRYSTHGPLGRYGRLLGTSLGANLFSVATAFVSSKIVWPYAALIVWIAFLTAFSLFVWVLLATFRNLRAWNKWSSMNAEKKMTRKLPASTR